jgi:hypothetical protein
MVTQKIKMFLYFFGMFGRRRFLARGEENHTNLMD